MFVRNQQTETAFAAPQPAVPQPHPAVPPRGATRNRAYSIIGADLVVKGTLFSAGEVQLDGKLEGDIRASGIIVGETAIIVGDVYAEEATIRGHVEGNISARKTQLCSTCHVEGNILHEALSIEIGAFFEGNCRHSENPLANATENVATAERKFSAPLQSIVELHRPQASAPTTRASRIFDRWRARAAAVANHSAL
jgi:cytoskeletal protein CcmA (bactofilin family)